VLYPLESMTFWAYWLSKAFNFTKHITIHGIDPMYVDDTMYFFEIHHLQHDTYIYIPEILRILGLPLGSPGTKCHLDVGPMANHRVYYKGEGGGFPQVWVVVNFVSLSLPVTHLSTKKCYSYALTNLWFGLCRSVWVIDRLSFFLVSSRRSNTPLYP
jgi:hypothetical protein